MDTSVVAFDLIWAATIVLFLMIIFAPVSCPLSYIMMVLAVVGEK
jgi:polyferredoxin